MHNATLRTMHIPLSKPLITENEIQRVADVLRSGWITSGPRVAEFQDAFADAVAAPRASVFASGTDALELALTAIRTQHRWPVGAIGAMVPALGFCSTVHAVIRAGLVPLLVDCDARTLNITHETLTDALYRHRDQVGVIIPTHMHGLPCDMSSIDGFAADIGAIVVEDAACAFPAATDSRTIGDPAGPIERITMFSFQATKTLTTGEGGALTGPDHILDEAEKLRLHGMTKDAWARTNSWRYDVDRIGLKANMTDIAAAIGLGQLEHARSDLARRRHVTEQYQIAFDDLPVDLLVEAPGTTWSRYAYPLRVASTRRDAVMAGLIDVGIGTTVYYPPINQLSVYAGRLEYPVDSVSDGEFSRMFAIPCHSGLTDSEVDYVINHVARLVA